MLSLRAVYPTLLSCPGAAAERKIKLSAQGTQTESPREPERASSPGGVYCPNAANVSPSHNL